MKIKFSKMLLVAALLSAAVLVLRLFVSAGKKIDFNTQVKPIFNKKCIGCHGGVKKKGDFSLLFREEALQKAKSGKFAIIPGNARASELIKRIKEKDEEERMPYKHEPLSKEEIRILEKWIKQGAEWGTHWAYVPVEQPEIPRVENNHIKNDIDRFVYQKLKQEKLQLSPEADKATLLRRVSLDLTGLPPEDNMAKKYLTDPSEEAYNSLVDQLLASPAYGERWTSLWMDISRYGDTKGYESDQPRVIWRYRDWLISAFNADKPYDQFLTEQLAGDLMPGADDEKYIATAFHRNTMTNDEGGTDNEEFRTAAVMDRVNTTWSALLGTTFNCVQCHSHPYDPFIHDEYYKFMAFFNNSRDEDTENDYPLLRCYKGKDSAAFISLTTWLAQNAKPEEAKWYTSFLKTIQPSINSQKCDNYEKGILFQNNYASLDINGTCRLPGIITQDKPQMIFRYLNNKGNAKLFVYTDSLNGPLLTTISLADTRQQWKIQMEDLPQLPGKHDLWFKFYCPVEKDKLPMLFDWFAFTTSFPGNGKTGYDDAKRQFTELLSAKAETTPVMVENNEEQKRSTHIFERGNWLVKGDEVAPGVPHIMNAMPANAPANRFGLAMWLTDKKNPLTARTMVNRLWEQLFGAGLAQTLEDLGTQGVPPVHQELLDYLSWKFMNEYKWSIKKLLKEIVSSATYRQTSISAPQLYQKDPENILLARFSRIRLSGEQMRDQALSVSKLLSKKMFGPGVMPYQPDGVWSSPYNPLKWILSEGEDQYRRGLYTFWKRTAPYPFMINFDGASREVCVVRRIRTNTPLQALNTLNDSAFLVMARQFAVNMRKADSTSVKAQVQKGYEAMMYKQITESKLKALLDLYGKAMIAYRNDPLSAAAMTGDRTKTVKPEEAALVVVANAMFNLDEWINKN